MQVPGGVCLRVQAVKTVASSCELTPTVTLLDKHLHQPLSAAESVEMSAKPDDRDTLLSRLHSVSEELDSE